MPNRSFRIYNVQTTIQKMRKNISKQNKKYNKYIQKQEKQEKQQKLDTLQIQRYAKNLRKYPSFTYYKYSDCPPIYKILYRKVKKLCIGMFIIFSVVYIEQMKYGYINAYINWLQKTFYFKISMKKYQKAKQSFDNNKYWEQIIQIYIQRLKNIYFKKQVQTILQQLKIKNLKLYHLMMCKNGIGIQNSNNFRALCQTRGAKIKRQITNGSLKKQQNNILDDQQIIMHELIAQKFVFDRFGRKFLIIFYVICEQPKLIDSSVSNSQCNNRNSNNSNNNEFNTLQSNKNSIQVQILQSYKFSKLHFNWSFNHSLRNQSKYLRENQLKKIHETLQNQIMLQLLKISLISPMRMYKKLLQDVIECIKGESQNNNENLIKLLKQLFQVNKKKQSLNILQALLNQGQTKSYYNYYKYYCKGRWILIEKYTAKIQLNKSKNRNRNAINNYNKQKNVINLQNSQKNKRIFIQYQKSRIKKQIIPLDVGFQDCVPIQFYNKRLSKRMSKTICNQKNY